VGVERIHLESIRRGEMAFSLQISAGQALVMQNVRGRAVAFKGNQLVFASLDGGRMTFPLNELAANSYGGIGSLRRFRERRQSENETGEEPQRTHPFHFTVTKALQSVFLLMAARVSLFVTCIVDQMFPKVGMAVVDVLERLGFRVDFPEGQTCCGQPAFNSGYREEAREVARHFLDVFRDVDYIVVPSGSCCSMVAHHFEDIFDKEPENLGRARRLEPKVYEFSRFLLEVAGVEDVGAKFDEVVTYHDSCHALRELRIKDGPRRLLGSVRGLELREMDAAEECCGFGGTFSVKFAEVSGGMARNKIDSILRTGASTVVSIDSSCLMQLQGALSRAGLPIRTLHLAEVLASR